MREIKKEWKSFGFASGQLQSTSPAVKGSFGCFFTVMNEQAAIGIVIYLGKSFISFWWLK